MCGLTLLCLCNLQEGLQDVFGRAAAVREEQLVHVESCTAEARTIVQLQHTALEFPAWCMYPNNNVALQYQKSHQLIRCNMV